MAAIVQLGPAVVVGFGSQTQAGYIMQTVSGPNPEADESTVVAEDGSTGTVLIADRKKTLNLEGVVTSVGLTAAEALLAGSTVTVNSVAYRVISGGCVIDRGPKETRVRLSLVKEESMTYT